MSRGIQGDRFALRALLLAILIGILIGSALVFTGIVHAAEPAASDHQPPRFLPAVVLYDKDDRFMVIEVGKTFSYTCKGALDDAQATIAKAAAAGRRLVGLCVPVPTYNPADLMPAAEPPKPSADNTV
jgi:hypothetical protein